MALKKKSMMVTLLIIIGLLPISSIIASERNDQMEFMSQIIVLSLEDALQKAVADNPSIEKMKLQFEQAKITSKASESQLITMLDEIGLRFSNKDSYQYINIAGLQELQIDYMRASAKRNYEASIVAKQAEVEEAFFGLLQAEEMVQINKENLDIATELYNVTQQKYKQGMISKQDVLNSELNKIKAENDYLASQNNLKRAKMFFNTNLAYDVMTNIQVQGEFKPKEFALDNLEKAIQSALEKRNEVKAMEFANQLEQLNTELVKKKYPDISYTYKEQMLKLEESNKGFENLKNNIELEVRSNYLDVIQKQREIEAGRLTVQLAEEGLKIARLSYEEGLSVFTEVQQAQIRVQQARLGLAQSILDYNVAVSKFEDSIGVGRATMGSGN